MVSLIEWINFFSLILSTFLMCYLYTLSIQPMKREEKRGEKVWKECKTLRSLSALLEVIIITNLLIWIWFPIPELNWIIHPNIWVGITIFFIIAIPSVIVWFLGVAHAGKETFEPSKDSEMYGGIYNYIRHPQSLGEYLALLAFVFATNCWFLVIVMAIVSIIYLPIMIHYEEADLIRRFGDSFREYQQRTGALIPKFWKKKL